MFVSPAYERMAGGLTLARRSSRFRLLNRGVSDGEGVVSHISQLAKRGEG